jgi:hypothetical protein
MQVGVRIPVVVVVRAARVELDKAHAALHEPPRQQALPPEVLRALVVHAIKPLHVLRFLVQFDRLGAVTCML